jgi:catechol 2,3-dioxygenase-like lactoylglutathione lyase family enzyme
MIKINSVSSIVYYVADLDKSAEFYGSLGFRPGERTDQSFKTFINWFSIEFRVAAVESIDNANTGAYAGIKVDDADEFYDFVKSKALTPLTDVTERPGKVREFTVADPDGYRLLFFSKK